MPENRGSMVGADEDPLYDVAVEPVEVEVAPGTLEGLAPAVPGDGRQSARQLMRWLNAGRLGSDRALIENTRKAWGALRRSPGAMEIARTQGYLAFACPTHKMIHCVECACPVCGAPGNCTCGGRSVDRHSGSPRLVRPVDGVRRVGYEFETMLADRAAVQRALNQYPFGYYDASLNASGWEQGIEFKVSSYGTDKGRAQVADIVDRLHSVGGIGAPHCCGHHVHVERTGDDCAETLRDRWLEVQVDLYRLFPTRQNNQWCEPVREYGYLDGHYTVVNRTGKGTWEVRLHPGTVSWVVAASWGAWVHGFVSGSGSRLGQAYLDARKAALAVTDGRNAHPWAWRRAIERWHRANGADHFRTLAEVATGRFAAYQDEASLRTVTAVRNNGEVR